MAHPNADLIRSTTEALNTGDIESFLGAHTEDAVVHVTGKNRYAGNFKGREGLAGAFQQLAGALDSPPSFEVHDAFGSDDHAVVLGIQKFSRGGRTLESQATVVAHVKDGKFTEVWITSNDPYAEDEFLA